jgi:signal peptidase I
VTSPPTEGRNSGPSPRTRRPTRAPVGRLTVVLAVLGVLILVGVVLVRTMVAVPVRIDSASMLPTYAEGDVVLVSRSAPDLADLHRGDLVTFRMPTDGERALKRVVGLPGDAVVILDGRLYVNDAVVEEPYVDHHLVDGYYTRTFHVPDETVLLFGDNRGNSVDSRDYGPVPVDDLLGRVMGRIWPVSR